MAEPAGSKLHIAVFPWLAFGHMIPFLELSKLIAQKGHRISFISTPRNIDRLPEIPKSLSGLIYFVKLPLPAEPNLPQGAEATSDLPFHQLPNLKKAHDRLQDDLGSFLKSAAPNWIIYDFAPHWLPPVAASLGISRAAFCTFNASSICTFGPSAEEVLAGNDPRKSPEEFTVPPRWVNFPTKVAFRLFEARQFLFHNTADASGDVPDMYRCAATVAGSDVIVVKSCSEIEGEWLKLLGELQRKPVFPIGLLPPSRKLEEEQETKDEKWEEIKEWLDKKETESVLYVAFGTETMLSPEELKEFALGLEKSGAPFFWVLRGEKELPDGFEQRIADRGLIWTNWAPQFRILGHESVAGFLTHCGWGSIIEGLYFGRPLVMLPFVLDQGLNARLFEEKQVGVEIPRNDEDGSFTSESVTESIRLVTADEKGEIYREKAKEMKQIVSDPQRQDKYVTNFLEYLKTHKRPVKNVLTQII